MNSSVYHAKSWERDFHKSPFIVIWEVTRACQLHCLHCRAEAQRHRDPRELTTEEGKRLIDEIAAMDHPLLVFTGGDPLEREDLFELIRYGREKGLAVSITPSATPRVTREAIQQAKDSGLTRWAFSLDGSTPAIHDRFRGTRGSYDLTISALNILRELNIPIQLNTTVSRYNVDDLANIAFVAEQYEAVLWSVFFLVPTGRARAQDMISAEEHEQVLEWLVELRKHSKFDVKTTEAPHYRRVMIQHVGENAGALLQIPQSAMRAGRSVNDGNGFVFISHIGDIYPSGFLPIVAGNVRREGLADVYQNAPVFRELRDSSKLLGKCGVCEFRNVCGGSRSRAYAMTGNYLESDPSCLYVPRDLRREM